MDQSLRKVYLHGRLEKLTGHKFVYLSGSTVYELVEGISANFKKELQPTPDRDKIVVKIDGFDTEESLHRPLEDDEKEIHIHPTLMGGGGKNGGLFKVIVGIILVAVVAWAVVATGGLAALAAGTTQLTWLGSTMLTTGIGLILGGVMEMMMPQPKIDLSASNDLEASKYLGAQGNTVRIGTPIPLILGRYRANGHFISFNVDSKNVAA